MLNLPDYNINRVSTTPATLLFDLFSKALKGSFVIHLVTVLLIP